ncbi:cytochrome C oxidase subunit III [Rickettsia amblyommatis]|nr:cytochrome c oxidase subunit 3 [Rickettsia amblyommatis]ALA61507.1 cytochrome C oxidase subunit III [Rickettsia amblyommatis]ARD87615.1 cytochrome C oxidase subunit III [Rickettsia amblyommatis]
MSQKIILNNSDSITKSHLFHIVDPSPWPVLTSFALLLLVIGGVSFMHGYKFNIYILSAGIISVGYCLYSWWRDVVKEGIVEHQHTSPVRKGLQIGMALFILTEIVFFGVFFASFFKSSLSPVGLLDGVWVVKQGIWPPPTIKTFEPFDIPFINTLILLLSGTTVTWAHYALEEKNQKDCVTALALTILLGIFFTTMQAYEYYHAAFKFTDGIYASNFYLATGFHGAHVIIGTIFLIICYFRAKRGDFTTEGNGHLGFECAAWYWHFVDVVWLFLFTFVYIFGS